MSINVRGYRTLKTKHSGDGANEGESKKVKGRRGAREKIGRMGGRKGRRKGKGHCDERNRREGRASPVCLLHHNPLARDASFVVDSKTRQATSSPHPTVSNLDLGIVPCLRDINQPSANVL